MTITATRAGRTFEVRLAYDDADPSAAVVLFTPMALGSDGTPRPDPGAESEMYTLTRRDLGRLRSMIERTESELARELRKREMR